MISLGKQKNSGLYSKVNFKNRVNSVYNRYTKVNLLSMVKVWENETKNMKIQPPAPPPAPVEIEKSPMFANSVFKPVTKFEVDKLNEPTVVNQYTLTKLLGKGAQGMVKLASDTKRLYAVKVINCEKLKKKFFIKKKELEEMLRVEVDLLKMFSHPNIVQFFEALYSEEFERLYIVLEYCSKGSLLSYIQSKEANCPEWEEVAKKICYEMSVGIHYMHDMEVVHRDIKTQNLLLSETKSAKLCDFNISTQMKRNKLQPVNTFLGTKLYSPPELIISSRDVYSAYAADIWSLAITIIEIVTKKHPFESMNLPQLQAAITQPISYHQKVQGLLRDLMDKMLQVNWRNRISIQDVLNHPWFKTASAPMVQGSTGKKQDQKAAAPLGVGQQKLSPPPQALPKT